MKRKPRAPLHSVLYRKRTGKAGQAPGSLTYVGDRAGSSTRVTLMDYREDGYTERLITSPSECVPFRDSKSVTWINVDGLSNPKVLEALGQAMGLHNLVLEDILNTDQRPKFEDYGGYLFLVAKMLEADPTTSRVQSEHLALVLGPGFVVSFQEIPGDPFEPVRGRIRSGSGKTRKMGADYLLYSLLDVTVDQYFAVLDRLGERIEALDDLMLRSESPRIMEDLHGLKRELLFLRKTVFPLREVVNALRHSSSALINEDSAPFLRDLHDHSVQIGDRIETYRDLLSSMLDLHLSTMTNRTNTVMKIVAVFSSIFLPLTFITGIFGMNFEFMPLLHSPGGFGVIVAGMVGIVTVMLAIFRWRRWI
ncbi:MAG: magnesium/cobalt transporter CorA [Burkholderiales bacterium]